MFRAMKPFTQNLLCVLAGVLAGSVAQVALAEAKPNPYQAIIERNPFGLRPPPPPPEEKPTVPVVPLSKVILTGITSMFGNARALMEVTDQEAGKTPAVRKPILREGDRDGSIEVIAIDVEKSVVKIRNGGIETNLVFDTPKLSPGMPPIAGLGGIPTLPTPGAPAVFSPANAAANNSGRSSFSVFGASSSTAPSGSAGGSSSVSALGNAGAPGNGLRQIPSRSLRTDGTGAAAPPVDAAAQYLMMHANSELSNSKGVPHPPVPPPPVPR